MHWIVPRYDLGEAEKGSLVPEKMELDLLVYLPQFFVGIYLETLLVITRGWSATELATSYLYNEGRFLIMSVNDWFQILVRLNCVFWVSESKASNSF